MENTHKDFEKNNAEKYGSKDDDVIARTYRENKLFGDVYCAKNSEKYLRRFLSNSVKGGNINDLYKVRDYVNRMIDENEKLSHTLKNEDIVDGK